MPRLGLGLGIGRRRPALAHEPPEVPENVLTFEGEPLTFEGEYLTFTPPEE